MPSERIERGITALLVMIALLVSGAAIRREVFGDRAALSNSDSHQQPEPVENWDTLVAAGTLVGDPTSPVKIVEFADLECPYCKRFHDRFRSLQRTSKGVALVFVHYPLEGHRFARPAARALECAGASGRFGEFLDSVFEHQDSLGLKSFASYAWESGVVDTIGFKNCASEVSPLSRVERGLAVGREIGVRGTPTIVINGWRYYTAPDDAALSLAVSRARNGQPPVLPNNR